MSCLHCVKAIKDELAKLLINSIKVSIGSAEVEYDENKVSREEISEAIKKAGYELAYGRHE